MYIEPPQNVPANYFEQVAVNLGTNLPALITSTGKYKTRNGKEVIIHAIDAPEKSTFNCKGTWYEVTKKGTRVPHYQIWHVNGRNVALGEHPLDVVKKLS